MTQAKEFIFEEAAREKLRLGIETLSEVAAVTLGPKGRNVGLSSSWGAPIITSDGHSIVKEIELKDQYVNMGIQMGRDVAAKMKDTCGDGTTTSLILLNALTQGGIKLVSSGASPILVKRGMETALQQIHAAIDASSQILESSHEIEKMAEAASSGSVDIGKMLGLAFQKVGKAGAITIEEGKTAEDILELAKGMQIDRGYLSPHFCTNRDKMEVELSHPRILITDKKIHSIHEILPLIQQVAASGSPLLIIAEDIEGDALATLVINSIRGILKVAAIKAPGFGENRKAMLEDLAILTHAQVITEDVGTLLKEATIDQLGTVEKVIISKDKTLFTQNREPNENLASRIKQLENQIVLSTVAYETEKLEERKAKLSGGVAVIKVGAPSEVEMKKRKQLYQDGLSSTKAALEQGIVIGAGMSLIRAASSLDNTLEGDAKLGFNLVLKACRAPALQLIKNVGFDPFTTLDEALSHKSTWGFNVVSEKMEDLKKTGVFDAAKVIKTALELAVSTAGIILLSEVLIGSAAED